MPKEQSPASGLQTALETWIERRDYLEKSLAEVADPGQEFALRKDIEEANRESARLRALLAPPADNPEPVPPPVLPGKRPVVFAAAGAAVLMILALSAWALWLKPDGTPVVVSVLDSQGEPLDDLIVEAFVEKEKMATARRAGPPGSYRFRSLPVGATARICASGSGFPEICLDHEVEPENLPLELAPTAR